MKKINLLALAVFLGFSSAKAQNTSQNVSLDSNHPIVLHDHSFDYGGQTIALGERSVLVNGYIKEPAASPYVFRDFQSAIDHVQRLEGSAPVTVYLAPYVYWVDNPDEPAVVTGKDGREPFGMTVEYHNLHLVGLNPDARHVVLASQRGQMQGAVGNFTMFNFQGDSLWVSHLTMGNYCNVDLDYPLAPALGRSKRSDAITQAHVGYVRGRWMSAQDVRFISRLNLNPLNGADRSEYDNCHFECTDDAMNGTAVYRHCDIDLYGQKPFWSTFRQGATFIDCDFRVMGQNREMYFCKQGGPLTLIRCRYHAPEGTYLGWTAYPQPWLRCYQQDFTMNGKPYVIGSQQPQNTVVMDGMAPIDRVQYLDISQHEAEMVTGEAPLTLQAGSAGEHIRWEVPAHYAAYVQLSAHEGATTQVTATNHTNEKAAFCITAHTDDGRQAACHVTVKPSVLPVPVFVRQPQISIRDGKAWLDFQLDLQGATDYSSVIWYADGLPVATGNGVELHEGLVGRTLSAVVCPRSNRSEAGSPVTAKGQRRVKSKMVSQRGRLDLDFSHFYCDWQPVIAEGCWTVDGYKPADTEEYPWSFDRTKPMWTYDEGFNGAVGFGLLQAQRGARIMYTPASRTYGDMSLTLQVDPTKTAGQGFGSATGQYMDVCLKFDTHTLTGYGLRIIRTVKHAKAVDFYLVAYDHGQVRALTDPVSSTCYRTGCTIRLQVAGNRFTADVTTTTPKPSDSDLPHEVHLSAAITPDTSSVPNTFGGVAIQHTGSCGESTTMLHRLQVEW